MRKYFFTGLVILLPLVLTIVIVIFLVNVLTRPFLGLAEWMVIQADWIQPLYERPGMQRFIHYSAQILVLLLLFAFTVLLGMIARWFFFKSLIRVSDHILHRIPIVNKVYKTTQEIIKTIFGDRAKSFKTVVMVPFPKSNAFCLGLVAGDSPPKCKAGAKSDLISVFVPTTPNPTSGYLLMYPREECIVMDMKVEEAIKFIISCGVVHHGTNGELEPEPILVDPDNIKPT